MIYNILIASITLSSVVIAAPHPPPPHGGQHGGPGHHHGPPPPPFLKNVTEEGRKAFFTIVKNDNLTIAAIDTEVAAWAKTYGVSDVYNAFEANMTAHRTQATQNATAVIKNLPTVQSQLEAILANKNVTRKAQHDQITALRNQYPQEVDSLFFINESGEEKPRGHKGPKGPRGPRGPRSSEESGEFGGL